MLGLYFFPTLSPCLSMGYFNYLIRPFDVSRFLVYLFVYFLMVDLGMTLYIYNLSQSSGVIILLFWVKYKNLAPFTSLYLLSFVIALNISSRIFLLDIGFWIASCFISALETYQIFFWFPWCLMKHPLSSNCFCTISKVSFVSLIFYLVFSVQKFDYDVSCRLLVHSASGIYRIMCIAKFRKYSGIVPYVIFQPCYLSSFIPHWTCSDPRRGKYGSSLLLGGGWNYGFPHDLL